MESQGSTVMEFYEEVEKVNNETSPFSLDLTYSHIMIYSVKSIGTSSTYERRGLLAYETP